MLPATRRVPGIRFEAEPPPPAVVLPRMDVAGFCGYAAAGPIDVPVPIEDVALFADVFGDDLPLAWDGVRGETVYAALGPCVRSFFRNGGRRCFVVRVAGEGVLATPFQLPGLVAVNGGEPEHALLRARSEGTWSDALRVAVSVASTPLVVRPVSLTAGTFDVASPAAGAARAGDLIRLSLGDNWTLQFVVSDPTDPQRSAQTQSPDGERVTLLRLTAGERLWSQPIADLSLGPRQRLHWIGPDGARRSARVSVERDGRVRVAGALDHGPAAGSLAYLSRDVWLNVTGVERAGGDVLLAFDALRLRQTPPPGLPRARALQAAERLELELWTGTRMLGGLGFAPAHPRFLGALPTDRALYDPRRRELPELWRAAREPRFPLAAPPSAPAAYFPIAASLLPETWLPAMPSSRNARRRDGLGRFRARVFVDQRLAPTRTPALLAEAHSLLYGSDAAAPEPLRGVHALLDIEEVTLVAAPDAAQAGWTAEHVEPAAPPAPPDSEDEPERATFSPCTPTRLAPPDLAVAGNSATGDLRLTWDEPPAGAQVIVEEAVDAGFQTIVVLYTGRDRSVALGARPPGAHWYRARFAAGPLAGPDAVLGPIDGGAPARAVVRRPEEYTDGVLLSVQRALVRMCAARGDTFALLALPEHYREDAAIGHAAALALGRTGVRTKVPPLGSGERGALAYASLHHPWLVTSTENRPQALRRTPPEGAIGGVCARRASERGAWVAPAHVELPDVVALSRPEEPRRRGELLAAQVNLIARTPRGFMAMTADTLAADPELRPIHVRRLLTLLRRLALRHGEMYAFEPNGEALRQTARRGFETVLGALFRLGAFSGVHPEDGFQVRAARGGDAEQLIVELRVAPSRPLTFITVRLVRAGDGRIEVVTA